MKTLNTIQTLSKIGKILSKIAYICCIVGLGGCVVGAVAMVVGANAANGSSTTLQSIFEAEANVSVGTVWAAIAVGAILCIGQIAVARMAWRYFKNELAAGTPFTFDGAKELLRLGISTAWIPVVSAIAAQIAQEVISQFMTNVEKLSFGGYDSVALGVMFIVASFLCKYGAELREVDKGSR